MKTKKTIIVCFFALLIFIWLVGIVLINNSKKQLKDYVDKDLYYSLNYVSNSIKSNMDSEILFFINGVQNVRLQKFMQEANKKLAKMKNPREYIKNIDSWWIDFPQGKTNKLIDEVVDFDMAQELICVDLCFNACGYSSCLNVFLTDSLGGLVLAPRKPLKYDYYHEKWWNNTKENGLYISNCFYDEDFKRYLMEFCVSIKDDQNNFLGVQRISVDIEKFLDLIVNSLDEYPLYSHHNANYVIIDTIGRVFFSKAKYNFLEKYNHLEEIKSKLNNGENVVELKYNIGKEKIIFFTTVRGGEDEEYNWIIISENDRSFIYSGVNSLVRYILFFCIFITVIFIILLFVFIRKLLSPIQLLHNEIQNIRESDFPYKTGITFSGEFSDLGNTLNEMFKKLIHYQEKFSSQKVEMTQIINNFKCEIKEKIKNRDLLLEEKEKLEITLKSIQDAVIIVDNNGIITMMNSCAEKLTGCTFKNDENIHIESVFYTQENRTRTFNDLLEILNSPKHDNYLSENVYLFSLNGMKYLIHNCMSAIINSQNLIIGVIFVFRDIADINNLDKEILESKNKYKSLINNAHIGIFRSAIEGKLISVNPAFVNILQGESEEKVLNEIHDIRNQLCYNSDNSINIVKELEKGIGFLNFDQRLFTLTGKLIIANLSFNLIRDRFGNPEFIDGFMEDVTDKKNAEENFYKIFNNNPECIIISTFYTGVILNVNKSFLNMFGFSFNEVVNKTSEELGIWGNYNNRESVINNVNDYGIVRNVELDLRIKSGKELTYLASFDKILYDGITCLLCIGRNIERRKRLDRA